ncbi:hypothetical protein BDW22DRAFT_1346077 [Trametopsis cervina]|nr:hypothetical protein BDW22DRAFT_1346077 [Trametopsis cervina]
MPCHLPVQQATFCLDVIIGDETQRSVFEMEDPVTAPPDDMRLTATRCCSILPESMQSTHGIVVRSHAKGPSSTEDAAMIKTGDGQLDEQPPHPSSTPRKLGNLPHVWCCTYNEKMTREGGQESVILPRPPLVPSRPPTKSAAGTHLLHERRHYLQGLRTDASQSDVGFVQERKVTRESLPPEFRGSIWRTARGEPEATRPTQSTRNQAVHSYDASSTYGANRCAVWHILARWR